MAERDEADLEEPEVETGGDTPAETEGAEPDSDIEARARLHGWIPEDEWDDAEMEKQGRRRPRKFVEARDYVDQMDNQLPLARAAARRSEGMVRDLKGEVAQIRDELKEAADLIKLQHANQQKLQRAAYERGVADAKARQKQAVREGDEEAFAKAEADLEQLQEDAPPPKAEEERAKPPPRQPQIDPTAKEWLDRNSWFVEDGILNAYMREQHAEICKAEGADVGNSYDGYEEAKKRVMAKFPEKFGINKRRQAPGTVANPNGGRTVPRNGADSRFAAIPRAHQAEYEKQRQMFAKRDIKFTKEEYMEAYES